MAVVRPGSTPLVARDGELNRVLDDMAEAFAISRPRVVLITGSAGSGKSRLLSEATSRISDGRGALVVEGYGMPSEGLPPYFALGRAVRRLSAVPGIAGALAPTAGALLGVAGLWPSTAGAEAAHPADRLQLFDALARLLEAAAGARPLVLALDDMQWAARADWDAIAYAVRAVEAPVAVLVAARPEVDAVESTAFPALRELSRLRRSSVVVLAPLSTAATGELAAALLGGGVAPGFATLIDDLTGGNPFLVEELCLRLHDSGKLALVDERWSLAANLDPRSSGASYAIAERLAALPGPAVAAIHAAAVIGRTGTAGLLARVEHVDPPRLAALLAEAARAGLLEVETPESWRFRHDLVRDAILEHVPDLSALHARVAEELDGEPSDAGQAAAIADHWARAGRPDRAVAHALEASRSASTRFAPHEALAMARIAVGQASAAGASLDAEERAAALERLGEAAVEAAEFTLADEAFRDLEALAARRGDTRLLGRARIGQGMVARRSERPDDAIPHLRAGIHALRDLPGAARDITRAWIALAAVHGLTRAEYATAEAEAEAAIAEARAIGDPALEAEALLALANSRARSIGPREARPLLEGALAHALAAGELQLAAEAAAALSNNHYWMGELIAARRFARVRLDVATRAHDPFGLRHARSWLALLAATGGSWDEAVSLLAEDEGWLRRLESPEPLAFARFVAAFVHLHTGPHDEAYRETSEAMALLAPLGDATLLWYASLHVLACVATARRDEAVVAAAAQELRLAAVEPSALPARSARCALGLAYARLGMTSEAARCDSFLRQFPDDFHWWPVRLARAEIALLCGEAAKAAAETETALACTRAEEQRPATALLLAARARALAPGDPRHRAAIQEAQTLATALGLANASATTPTSAGAAHGLTPRECEVLALVADGLSNRAVAERLVLSERTVINHLSHIFAKLEVESRAAAAAWAIRNGLA